MRSLGRVAGYSEKLSVFICEPGLLSAAVAGQVHYDPLALHKFCSMLPAFTFTVHPVVPVRDAIRVELEAMAFRDGLKAR
jgi:hypothetical protein